MLCLVSKDEKHTFTLGTQESASWNPGSDLDSLPSVNYGYAEKKVTVLLQCSPEGNNEFQVFGEDPLNSYKFQLTHKCACWNGCSSGNEWEWKIILLTFFFYFRYTFHYNNTNINGHYNHYHCS